MTTISPPLVASVPLMRARLLARPPLMSPMCASGACPITANPIRAMIYAGIMGWLLSVVLRPERREAACEE